MQFNKFILLFLVFLVFIACSEPKTVPPQPAFYHWQTAFQIEKSQEELLRQFNCEKLFVKFFDVDWNAARKQIQPTALIQIDSVLPNIIKEVIPVVFITNRSFKESSPLEREQLPTRIAKLCLALIKQLPIQVQVNEIQIDCDWSKSTKEDYFDFLAQLREELKGNNFQFSSTIRLHQFASPAQTGIPPVDRGTLMFYNIGEVSSWQENNSIISMEAALPYLNATKPNAYPLPLDLALPVFSWGIIFRDGRLAHLINDLSLEELRDTNQFEAISPYRYKIRQNTYFKAYYLYKNDLIRLEHVTPAQLQASQAVLAPFFGKQPYTKILYHIDAKNLSYFTYEDLESIFN